MNLPKKILDRLANKLHSKFHNVEWDETWSEEGSETNCESWRQCAQAVITEYENWLKETPKLEIHD